MSETKLPLREQIARIIADDACEHGEKCDAVEWHSEAADKIIALVRSEQSKDDTRGEPYLDGTSDEVKEAAREAAISYSNPSSRWHFMFGFTVGANWFRFPKQAEGLTPAEVSALSYCVARAQLDNETLRHDVVRAAKDALARFE